METREYQDEPPAVKWPIAPDGYIPNSVIRGWTEAQKRATWRSDSEENIQEDKEVFIGFYGENYRSIRAQRRAKKDKKTPYLQWDDRPNLDAPIWQGSQEEDLKGKRLSEQDAGKDEDKHYTSLLGLKGAKMGFEQKVGFDKRLQNTAKGPTETHLVRKMANNRDKSYEQSRKETKTVQELQGEDVSNQDMVKQNETTEEQVQEMFVGPMDFEKTASTKQLGQKLEIKMFKSASDAKNITLGSDDGDATSSDIQTETNNKILQTTNVRVENKQIRKIQTEEKTRNIKKTPEIDPEESTESSTEEIHHLRFNQVPILQKGPAVPHPEQREVKNPNGDKTKLKSKHHKLSEANKQQAASEKQDIAKIKDKPIKPPVKPPVKPLVPPAEPQMHGSFALADTPTPKKTTEKSMQPTEEQKESRNPLTSKQTKAPNLDQKPQTVAAAPKSHFSTTSRDPIQAHVDQKVLGVYKQFKAGKWISSKPHGKGSTTNLYRSKSRWSFSGTDVDGLATAESLYQRGSREEAEGGPTHLFGQTGLWQLIMNGVSGSMDQERLQRLLEERPKDLQTSSDMREFTEMMDRSSLAESGCAKPSTSTRFEATQEPVDNATSWGLIRDVPSDFQTRSNDMGGHSRCNSDIIQGRNAEPGTSMDQNSCRTLPVEGSRASGKLRDLALESLDQTTLRRSTEGRSTEHIAGPGRLDFGVVNKEVSMFERGVGSRESSPQSTTLTGLDGKDYTDESHWSVSKRLGPGQSKLDRSSNINHRETDSRTSLKPDSQLKQMSQSSAKSTHGFDEIKNDNYDRRRQSTAGIIRSRSQTEALGQEQLGTTPQVQVDSRCRTEQSRSHGSALLQGSVEFMGQPGYERVTELTYPGLESGMRFNELQTSLDRTGVASPEDSRSTMFSKQTGFQELHPSRSYGCTQNGLNGSDQSMGYYGAGWEHSHSSHSGVAMDESDLDGFDSAAQAESEGRVGHRKSLSFTVLKGGKIGGSSKDRSEDSRQSTQGYMQSTDEPKPGDRTQNLLGLQTVRSMVHTHGLLTSSKPEEFLKTFSRNDHGDKTKTKPMPKWKQGLYQLIFLYGFCSPKTAKLLAREQHKQTQPKSTKQQRENIELYQVWNPITTSALHKRVVWRVQFQDILDQAASRFHCMTPLPSINNFITLEEYGETEYGKLLFEWERGDEDEQMEVVSASVSV